MTTPPNWPGGQPVPQQPWQPPPGGPPPWTYPPPATGFPPPSAPPRNRKPLIITVVATVAVLVVVAVVVLVLVGTRDEGGSTSDQAVGDVAKSYLEALSRGDAQAALALGATQPPNTDLLTDEVLRKQLDALPISNIEILGESREPGESEDRTEVRMAVKLGDKRTEGKIRMVRSQGAWKLDSSFVKVSIVAGVPTSSDTTLVAFGKPVGGSADFYAFPGPLELTSSSPFIDVNPVAPLSFDDLGSMEVLGAKYSMNDDGRKALEQLVTDKYAPCYGDDPKPAQCQSVAYPGVEYDKSTTTFTAPLDVSELTYTFEGTLTSAMVSGTIKNVPITMRRNDGRVVPMTGNVPVFMMVDIGKKPPVVLTK
ncbi:hypothetical protein FK535_26115 [Mycolicibacterium sp. 018/SC-01/001]|uniref:hypothetical protein n=1 Tax=Mycolicibacterium sp. 018/SC-01/001 TaxID=2592069 RepID=UPI0011814315|nr:hypothetical protein [Mycolicibacterium sp. 018/SC-01/001]TRW78236.1 hypothetical protein FK535_26115 [Mycolicibacterium sp. 018/SC-01/001]